MLGEPAAVLLEQVDVRVALEQQIARQPQRDHLANEARRKVRLHEVVRNVCTAHKHTKQTTVSEATRFRRQSGAKREQLTEWELRRPGKRI